MRPKRKKRNIKKGTKGDGVDKASKKGIVKKLIKANDTKT